MKPETLSHPLSIIGALVTTSSAALFITLTIAALAGMLTNPYAGLVVFVAIPACFVIGLLLIPAGIWLQRRRVARDHTAAEWPVIDFRRARVRRTTLVVAALTVVNIVIVLLAGYGSLHWMESPRFCGQVCHTPMQPQFAAWSRGPHARVACATCHIGEGAAAFVHAKLAGVRQLAHVVTGTYPRPIPPGTNMPAGTQGETCRGCHRPERASGERIVVLREYADDEASTETKTVLQMHVGRGSASGRAIHWHADPSIRVEYVATDEARQTIPYVRVTDGSGRTKEYATPDATDQVKAGTRRAMDCVDCHNAVGHPFGPTPEKAVDRAIAAGLVSRELPHARRDAVRLLTASHASDGEALRAIERGLQGSDESSAGGTDRQAVARSVSALQQLYRTNVFPSMKVKWDTYPTNNGHITSNGCFRCHDDSHKAADGSAISGDCDYCHKQIEGEF